MGGPDVTRSSYFLLGSGATLVAILLLWGIFGLPTVPEVDDRARQEAVERLRDAERVVGSLRDSLALERASADTVIIHAEAQAGQAMRKAQAAGVEVVAGLDSLEVSVRPELRQMVGDVRRMVLVEREEREAVHAAQVVHIQALETQLAGADRMIAELTELRTLDAAVIYATQDVSDQWRARAEAFERQFKSERLRRIVGEIGMAALAVAGVVLLVVK